MTTFLLLLIFFALVGDMAARWVWTQENAPKKRSRAIPMGTEGTKKPGRPRKAEKPPIPPPGTSLPME